MTTPIPFTPITRQAGTQPANPVTADAQYAAEIDAGFAGINTWINGSTTNWWEVVTWSPLVTWATNFAAATGFASNYGYALGELRFLCIRFIYTGPGLNVDNQGNIFILTKIGTLAAAFCKGITAPQTHGQRFYLPCQIGSSTPAMSGGTYLTADGSLYLDAVSYGNQTVPSSLSFSLTHTFIVRGAG